MKKTRMAAGVFAATCISIFAAGSASAQTADGSELRGATARVELAGGVVNNVNFHPDGTATIVGRSGNSVNANWYVQGQQLCLQTSSARECWAYQGPFRNGQSLSLTSDCGSSSRWTASSVQEPAAPSRAGERG